MRHRQFLYIILFLSACSSSFNKEIENDFLSYINSQNELRVEQNVLEFDRVLGPIMNVQAFLENQYVLIEGQKWIVHQFDYEYNTAIELGGLGSGPGEFQLINHSYLSDDGQLLLLDLRLKRVSIFRLNENDSELISIINLPNYELRIQKIFPLSNNHFIGIFREYSSSNDDFFEQIVLQLDEKLNPIAEVGRFYGGELIRIGGNLTVNEIGAKSIWHFYNDELFYARSDSFQITKVQDIGLNKLINDENPLSMIPKFKNDNFIKSNMSAHSKFVISAIPEMKSIFNESEYFSYFTEFIVKNNVVYFNILNLTDSNGYVLKYHIDTKDIAVIKTPPVFRLKQVFDSTILGISYTEGLNEVVALHF